MATPTSELFSQNTEDSMVKTILGIVLGYIAMSVVLFLLFSALYMVLGTSGSFQAGSLYVSTIWLIAGFVIFFVGAVAAGAVSSLISKSPKAGLLMGVVIVILGVIMAFGQISQMPESMVREAQEIPMMEAMSIAQQPVWALFVNPLFGLFGALTGGSLFGSND
jgi:hypothetical protein